MSSHGAEVKRYLTIASYLFQAMTRPDLEVLEDWCYEAVRGVLYFIIQIPCHCLNLEFTTHSLKYTGIYLCKYMVLFSVV